MTDGLLLELLSDDFTVCKVASLAGVSLEAPFVFTARTDEELSVVCRTGDAPEDCLAREDGWRALRVCGQLDFSLVGILAGLTAALAAAGVSVFALSTYNTDYILLRETQLSVAQAALAGAGYQFK